MAQVRKSREVAGEEAGSAPTVLELRVHGVNNAAPHGMLEVGAGDVEQTRGDSLGSFWQLTDAALAHGRRVPPTHHDHVLAGVRREAYSWGAMARSSPSLPGGFARAAVSAVSRAGWLLLLPLGLANVAYWSRAIPEPGRSGRGARSVRVFSLGLSLLTVTAVIAVSLDMIGTQCIKDSGDTAEVACSALPGWLGWLTAFTWTQRLVVLSLAPVAALLLLRWLAAASRVRYEHATAQATDGAGDGAAGRGPARPGGAHLSGREVPPVLARPGPVVAMGARPHDGQPPCRRGAGARRRHPVLDAGLCRRPGLPLRDDMVRRPVLPPRHHRRVRRRPRVRRPAPRRSGARSARGLAGRRGPRGRHAPPGAPARGRQGAARDRARRHGPQRHDGLAGHPRGSRGCRARATRRRGPVRATGRPPRAPRAPRRPRRSIRSTAPRVASRSRRARCPASGPRGSPGHPPERGGSRPGPRARG